MKHGIALPSRWSPRRITPTHEKPESLNSSSRGIAGAKGQGKTMFVRKLAVALNIRCIRLDIELVRSREGFVAALTKLVH